MLDNIKYFGNHDLLKFHKTAFLCSRQIPAAAVLKCYDWAIEQREKMVCVVSGFHSQIEKEIFEILIKGKQPLILVHARGRMKKQPEVIKELLQTSRLLLIFPFEDKVKRVTTQTAKQRNSKIIEMADEIVVGYAKEDGQLSRLLRKNIGDKRIRYL